MIKTKTIAKGKCLGSPARQRDSLVFWTFKRWIHGWPATDVGWDGMKTAAIKATTFFKVVLPTPLATTLSISRAVDRHLVKKYLK